MILPLYHSLRDLQTYHRPWLCCLTADPCPVVITTMHVSRYSLNSIVLLQGFQFYCFLQEVFGSCPFLTFFDFHYRSTSKFHPPPLPSQQCHFIHKRQVSRGMKFMNENMWFLCDLRIVMTLTYNI